MREIEEMYRRYAAELEARIAMNRKDISQCRTVIANADASIEKDLLTLAELRRLIEKDSHD